MRSLTLCFLLTGVVTSENVYTNSKAWQSIGDKMSLPEENLKGKTKDTLHHAQLFGFAFLSSNPFYSLTKQIFKLDQTLVSYLVVEDHDLF